MSDNDEGNHATFKTGNPNETDIHINISLLPTGSSVVVQHKDGGPWVHEMIKEYG